MTGAGERDALAAEESMFGKWSGVSELGIRAAARTLPRRGKQRRRPGSRRPGFRRPGSRRPGSRRPGFRRPGFRRPGSRRPDSRRPVSRRPDSRRPVSRRPGFRRPGFRRPGFRRPDSRRPTHRRPRPRRSGSRCRPSPYLSPERHRPRRVPAIDWPCRGRPGHVAGSDLPKGWSTGCRRRRTGGEGQINGEWETLFLLCPASKASPRAL